MKKTTKTTHESCSYTVPRNNEQGQVTTQYLDAEREITPDESGTQSHSPGMPTLSRVRERSMAQSSEFQRL